MDKDWPFSQKIIYSSLVFINWTISSSIIWATTRKNVPSEFFLISEKQVRFERVMFPKSNSFHLTGLIKVLCEIWLIYNMYPFNVIVLKNGAKVAHCISACYCCSENSLFC